MSPRVIAAGALVLVVGLAAGLLISNAVGDGSGPDISSPEPTAVPATTDPDAPAPPAAECADAQAVVDESNATFDEIVTTNEEGVNYWAALLVEQQTIAYVMQQFPECFTLADRAGAIALVDGLQVLATAAAQRVSVDEPPGDGSDPTTPVDEPIDGSDPTTTIDGSDQ